MGALIEIIGSSFSGKTYLISQLLEELEDIKVILFEKHFVRDDIKLGYKNFYNDVTLTLFNNNVISECVYGHKANIYTNFKFPRHLTILCEPEYQEHFKRCKRYQEKFGTQAMWNRIGEHSITGIRNDARKNLEDYLLYDGTNFDKILKNVKEHLNVFGQSNNQ